MILCVFMLFIILQKQIIMAKLLEFNPDIILNFQAYVSHSLDKNRVIRQFLTIVKNVCELQEFYARNMQNLAETTSKLVIDKDILSQIFLTFSKILKSKSDEAKKKIQDINKDMIPCINKVLSEQNLSFKHIQKITKEIQLEMEKSHKLLQIYKNAYTKAYKQLNRNYSLNSPQLKQELKSTHKTKEIQLIENISNYNNVVQKYLVILLDMNNQFTQCEAERMRNIKTAVNKYIIFEISSIKNLEYDIDRYCKRLDQSKKLRNQLPIAERSIQSQSKEKISICKISPANFIQHIKIEILQREKLNKRNIFDVNELKVKYYGEIDQNKYNLLLKQIYVYLDHIKEIKDIDTFKKLMKYSKEVYKLLPDMDLNIRKIYLSDGVLCHDMFREKEFQEFYLKTLIDSVQKQSGSRYLQGIQKQYNHLKEEIALIKSFRIEAIQQLIIKLQSLVLDNQSNLISKQKSLNFYQENNKVAGQDKK